MSFGCEELREAVEGGGVGIRARISLAPLGGTGDKVFPPTYGVVDTGHTKYALEERVAAGEQAKAGDRLVKAVVLDSVASQANRFELALLDAARGGTLAVPVTSVDFRDVEGLEGLDRISDFEAPHRIFDALLRDSFDAGEWFRNGPAGRAVTEASEANAAALLHHSPHTLVFGGWDSTGPRGGLGAKYERAITSEIVATDIQVGVKTASRIDPAGIERRAGPLYQTPDNGWTLDEGEALMEKGKAKLYTRGSGDPGRPSQVNHGNVTPSIDAEAGGITARHITATTVLSLIQLRRLRFPTGVDGAPIGDARRKEAETAARTALAALGLAAAVLAFEAGFDLRSRCVLVPDGAFAFELVTRDGTTTPIDLRGSDALDLVADAADHSADAGLAWRDRELLLRPSDRLVQLIRRSRSLGVAPGEAS